MKGKKVLNLVLGGVFALGLIGGAATFVQSASAAPAAVSTAAASSIVLVHRGGGGSLGSNDQALADALGIDLEALQTAEETARLAMIDQAVADGLLTETQAEQWRLYSGGFGRGFSGAYDRDEYLADALGITVEELEAAKVEAYEVQLAAAVAAGTLTQAEADLMLAAKVAKTYLDTETIDAQIQAAQEAAIAAALDDGAITQEQADALLAQLETDPYRFNGGFGGGRHGRGGPGFGGFDLDLLPDTTTSDTISDTSLDA